MFFDEYCKLCNSVGKAPTTCAIEMGFHKSEVTRWKQGTTPRRANLLRIAGYFGVEPDDLLKGETKKPVQQDGQSEVKQMLNSLLSELSDEDASVLLILAKQLTARAKSPGDSQ